MHHINEEWSSSARRPVYIIVIFRANEKMLLSDIPSNTLGKVVALGLHVGNEVGDDDRFARSSLKTPDFK